MADRILIALLVMAAGVAAYLLLQQWQRRKASLAIATAPPVATELRRPTILYFRSDACAPCAAQSRYLDQLAAQMGESIVVRRIDADAEPDLASQFGVFTVPTTLVVSAGGEVRHANYGLADAGKLAAQLRNL
jgi:thioredoxin 1